MNSINHAAGIIGEGKGERWKKSKTHNYNDTQNTPYNVITVVIQVHTLRFFFIIAVLGIINTLPYAYFPPQKNSVWKKSIYIHKASTT